jgi:glycosyltransferase involved in cell wall biosynthesis
VSVIIPVYNDPDGIRKTLNSILGNTHKDVPLEIIVVDNNSTDETNKVIKQFSEEIPYIQYTFEGEIQTSYAARNTGIQHSHGDLIVFLDANVEVSEGWLDSAISEMQSKDAHYMGCNVKIVDDNKKQTIFSQYNQHSAFPIKELIEKHGYTPTVCLFVTQELINDVGEFDQRLVSTGDLEFGNRVNEQGYTLYYTDEVTVIHPARTSFKSLVNRNIRIGRGHCQLQRYHSSRYGSPGIPPRPSGITSNQFDSKQNPGWAIIDMSLTLTRGIGYFYEFTRGILYQQ